MREEELELILRQPPRWLTRDIAQILKNDVDLSGDIIHDAAQRILLGYQEMQLTTERQVHGCWKRIAVNLAYDRLKQPGVKRRDWSYYGGREDTSSCGLNEFDRSQGRYRLKYSELKSPWEETDRKIDVERAKARLTKIDFAQDIVELVAEGYTWREIPELLGKRRSTVHRLWRKRIVPILKEILKDYEERLGFTLRKAREHSYDMEGR